MVTTALSCRRFGISESRASGRISRLASGARGPLASRRWAQGSVRRPARTFSRRAPPRSSGVTRPPGTIQQTNQSHQNFNPTPCGSNFNFTPRSDEHTRTPLHPAALASVPYGIVLVRVRVRVRAPVLTGGPGRRPGVWLRRTGRGICAYRGGSFPIARDLCLCVHVSMCLCLLK